MVILITVPESITIPEEIICYGAAGLDSSIVNCTTDPEKNTITIPNGFDKRDIAPQLVRLTFESLFNPNKHINTKSWKIETFTYDGYAIDYIDEGITINFYCVTPCKTCNLDEPT